MGLCVLYYVEYSLYNVKKSRIFLSGLELHFKSVFSHSRSDSLFSDHGNYSVISITMQCSVKRGFMYLRKVSANARTCNRQRLTWLVGWLNGVLRCSQQYFSHITATAHIIHVFPGFHQCYAGALKCLAEGHTNEKPRGSSAAQTQDPWIMSQTLYY